MSQEKAQLIAPIGIMTVSGVTATGVITATSLSGNIAGAAKSLVNGTDVFSWQAIDETIQQPELVKGGLTGFLSKGINRTFFSRDINGDGREDLIIPGAGNLTLYIANNGKGFNSAVTVKTNNRIRTSLQTLSLIHI